MSATGRGAPAQSATADREIVISRVISAPRELVFEAFTEVRHLSRWWGPEGFTTTTRAFEFRVGGEWDFVMHGPDGTDYQEWICWTGIAPPELARLSELPGLRALERSRMLVPALDRASHDHIRSPQPRTKSLGYPPPPPVDRKMRVPRDDVDQDQGRQQIHQAHQGEALECQQRCHDDRPEERQPSRAEVQPATPVPGQADEPSLGELVQLGQPCRRFLDVKGASSAARLTA